MFVRQRWNTGIAIYLRGEIPNTYTQRCRIHLKYQQDLNIYEPTTRLLLQIYHELRTKKSIKSLQVRQPHGANIYFNHTCNQLMYSTL